jgi:hypothetical protein
MPLLRENTGTVFRSIEKSWKRGAYYYGGEKKVVFI